MVDDQVVNERRDNRIGEFCEKLAKEVGADSIHLVVHFPLEDWLLLREQEDRGHDAEECNCRADKEHKTTSILHSFDVALESLENDVRGNGSLKYAHDSHNEVLWKPIEVLERAICEQLELVPEPCVVAKDFIRVNLHDFGAFE